MKKVTIYHNNRCSKSRQALCLLDECNADIEVVQYINDPMSKATLKSILKKLVKTKKVRTKIIKLKQDIDKPNFGRD